MKSALSYRSRCENEASRRLYRGAAETAQRLEQTLNQISNFHNLFSPEITDLRTRLKDYCERLMFTDPVAYGRKAEDLLWRKVYYEFFQKCKQNRNLLESEYHCHSLRTHLLAAVGSYHHMLLRIQTEFHVDLNTRVDAPFLWHVKGVKKERWKKYQQSSAGDSAIHSWANQASHRILTYLGDLARYMSELQPDHRSLELENRHLAERYYLQAYCLNPRSGIPHNQMGSLANNRFDSAYHYMRCLSSPERFDAAEGNLVRVLEKNNQAVQDLESVAGTSSEKPLKCKMFLAKFLKLCEIFYFTSDDNLQKYCQEALQDFDACIVPDEEELVENASSESSFGSSTIDDERVFKIVVMCMLCISKLHERGSSDVSTATAFTLALFSSVIHSCIHQINLSVFENFVEERSTPEQDHLINEENPPALDLNTKTKEEIKNKMNEIGPLSSGKKGSSRKNMTKFNSKRLRKMRRRRKISSTSQEDSEISDVEVLELADESDEENDVLNSDVSQTGSCSSESISEHEDLLNVENNIENESKSTSENFSDDAYINNTDNSDKENLKKVKPVSSNDVRNKDGSRNVANGSAQVLLSPEKIADALLKSAFMPTLKVLVDWLQTHKELLKLCAESLQFLLSRLTVLLNLLLKIETELLKLKDNFPALKRSGKKWLQVIPLPEDMLLQYLPGLESVQSNFDNDISKRRDLTPIQVMFLRLQCILSFGDHLSKSPDSLISFDREKNEYVLKTLDLLKEKSDDKINNMDSHDLIGDNMNHQRQQLMHEMAHLWLKSEVNSLEMSVKSSANPQLSPLLVADTSALCHHLPLLKQLIAAKSFVVIVPKVVIDNLDQLKKKSLGAREAIRWLEFIFQKGSRHVRTQRDGERCGLHPMKYPKRKDKESWNYFQILECCSYLVQQQQHVEKTSCPLVTFLFGTNNRLPSNAAALAKSLNICMENVESFFTKWRSSIKKPG